jgi:hypothetical protein
MRALARSAPVRSVAAEIETAFLRALESPVQVEQRVRWREVRLFGSWAFQINEARRQVRLAEVDRAGRAWLREEDFEIGDALANWTAMRRFLVPWRQRIHAAIGFRAREDRSVVRVCDWLARGLWDELVQRDLVGRIRGDVREALALDPQITKLGLRSVFPRTRVSIKQGPRRLVLRRSPMLSAGVYCRVWQARETWERVASEAPALLPVLSILYEAGVEPGGERVLQRVKQKFLDAGGSNRAWRYLAQQGVRRLDIVCACADSRPMFPVLARMSRLFVELDLDRNPCASRVVQEILGRVAEESSGRTLLRSLDSTLPLLRLSLAEGARRACEGSLRQFLDGAFLEVVAAWKAHESAATAKLRARNWNDLRFQLDEWAENRMQPDGPRKPILRVADAGPNRVVPLSTPAELILEGLAMNHCAGIYAVLRDCHDRAFFSIRDRGNGERLATFRLDRGGMVWSVGDIAGVSNRPVPKTLKTLAHRIARQYTWAYLRQAPNDVGKMAASALVRLAHSIRDAIGRIRLRTWASIRRPGRSRAKREWFNSRF